MPKSGHSVGSKFKTYVTTGAPLDVSNLPGAEVRCECPGGPAGSLKQPVRSRPNLAIAPTVVSHDGCLELAPAITRSTEPGDTRRRIRDLAGRFGLKCR